MVAVAAGRQVRLPRLPAVVAPTFAAIISALAFVAVRPDVGDLQAALAR